MNLSKNAYLFNPRFAFPDPAGFHRLVLAEVRRARGVQALCLRCSRPCKVLAARRSKFFCFDRKFNGRGIK